MSALYGLAIGLADKTYSESSHLFISDCRQLWPYIDYDMVVAFKGSSSIADLVDDADVNMVPFLSNDSMYVHKGFQRNYLKCRQNLLERIDSKHPTKLLLCGHSLGGALCYLGSMDLADRFPDILIDTVTFGSPKVGDEAFQQTFESRASTLEGHHARIVTRKDPIPAYPFVGFYHATSGCIPLGSRKRGVPLEHHSIRSYKHAVRSPIKYI